MPLQTILTEFTAACGQCTALIANAHQTDSGGGHILPSRDREQITVAAFLNLFIGWETFLEASIVAALLGDPTISGSKPAPYFQPTSREHALRAIVGINRYFDFGNQENVRKIVELYFPSGYPFEPHLGAIFSDLADMRTMRNASAHITSTTQAALETLALRILGAPQPGVKLYHLLTSNDPRSHAGNTVFDEYRIKLEAAAGLMANG